MATFVLQVQRPIQDRGSVESRRDHSIHKVSVLVMCMQRYKLKISKKEIYSFRRRFFFF